MHSEPDSWCRPWQVGRGEPCSVVTGAGSGIHQVRGPLAPKRRYPVQAVASASSSIAKRTPKSPPARSGRRIANTMSPVGMATKIAPIAFPVQSCQPGGREEPPLARQNRSSQSAGNTRYRAMRAITFAKCMTSEDTTINRNGPGSVIPDQTTGRRGTVRSAGANPALWC